MYSIEGGMQVYFVTIAPAASYTCNYPKGAEIPIQRTLPTDKLTTIDI